MACREGWTNDLQCRVRGEAEAGQASFLTFTRANALRFCKRKHRLSGAAQGRGLPWRSEWGTQAAHNFHNRSWNEPYLGDSKL